MPPQGQALFTRKEAELIIDMCQSWEEGVVVAKTETTVDPTVETPEELVDLSSSYDDQVHLVKSIREKVAYGVYID